MNINKEYLNSKTIEEMREFFDNQGFLQLKKFFDSKDVEILEEKLSKHTFVKTYNPLICRKEILETKELYIPEILELIEMFKSKEWISYIEQITEFNLQFKKINVEKYQHKDFEILNDKAQREDRLQIIYDLTPKWKKEWGGYLTFTTQEEELLYLEPEYNTLNLIFKASELMTYLKYINNRAKDNKILRIIVEYDFIEDLS